MDLFIGFILGALALGFLWALRELERRQAFEDVAEQIETLRGDNTKLRALERHYRQGFVYFKDGMRELRNDLGGKGSLPATAEHAGRHIVRVTTRLQGTSGSSLNGGPIFKGRWR